MKKFISCCCSLFVLSACIQPTDAPKYDYKTIKPVIATIAVYTGWKKDKDTAINEVTSKLESNAKAACRNSGQGWTFNEFKNRGEIECEETSDGHRCRNINIELECRKINER